MDVEVKPVIGIPHVGDIPGFFFDTVAALVTPPQTPIVRVQNKPIDLARNMIVEAFLSKPDATHLFFMDADMRFPHDALNRLVLADKDIVCGAYFARSVPPIPHFYQFHHEDNADGTCPIAREHDGSGRWYRTMAREFADFSKRHPDYRSLPTVTSLPRTPDSLVPIEAAGGGCLLIKRAVLEAMEYPYFKCHERSAGGEDFYFFEKARALGFEAWGDWSVQCEHEYRGMFMDRADFEDWFRLGQPDEEPLDVDLIVDMAPQPNVASAAG